MRVKPARLPASLQRLCCALRPYNRSLLQTYLSRTTGQGEECDVLSSAAAAEQDGFRPCLRCRSETAPFSPAWKGSQTIVERAGRGRSEVESHHGLFQHG
jgi:hypothetical protein